MPHFDPLPVTSDDSFHGDPPAPDTPFFAVGDVHGRLDLLAPLLDRLGTSGEPIILVGDYIDRGDDSAGVLRHLQQAMAERHVICLRGNHEEMLLKFIAKPRQNGRLWLQHGGMQTLASFGIEGPSEHADPAQWLAARDALVAALGDTLGWVQALPYLWQSGNVAVLHAGADPRQPLGTQSQKALAWGHPDFHHLPRTDGTWVVHGHTVVPEPQIANGRVGIDTGAYSTGRLTAVRVQAGSITRC